jgi:hypothetical protein
MLLTICLTFVGTSLLYAMLFGFAGWRVVRHLRGNAEATAAVVAHVLLPLWGGGQMPLVQPIEHDVSHDGQAVSRL